MPHQPVSRKGRMIRRIAVTAAILLLLASVALNLHFLLRGKITYLQEPEQIAIMEAGILQNNLTFGPGEELSFVYDFEHPDYAALRESYDIATIAGEGTEMERAIRLMDAFAPRLTHQSSFAADVPFRALPLLEYSLDNRDQGINCRGKAQILNEMCLSLGIYARKVWIMPYSSYDSDCHVVNEVWDSTLGKWVMLDITNNEYWIDENGTPLSVLEIRERGALRQFCTPVSPGESTADPAILLDRHMGSFLYIMKNMVFMEYCPVYTAGETFPVHRLSPASLTSDNKPPVSLDVCLQPPVQ